MQNTKEMIASESIKLFYENGYQKTSMRQIAEACNISHPTIFSHFKNKNAIADIMFYRYLHGFVSMTGRYIEDKGIDISANHEAMVFYWTAHYYYLKEDRRYFNFLQEYCTLQKMTDFVNVNYFRQVFKKFILVNYKETLENQLLYMRIISSVVLVISQSYYEDLISLEAAVMEHFHHLYATFKINRGISNEGIIEFLQNFDEKKYLGHCLLEDVLLSDFGKPYQNISHENLFV